MGNDHHTNQPSVGDRIDVTLRPVRRNAPRKNTGFRRESLSLVKKVRRSLERDKDLPLSQKLHKAFVYASSTVSGYFHLSGCTRVGKRARTRGAPYIVNYGRIVIGDDFNLSSRIVPSELATGHKATIEIGDEVSINFGALISAVKLVRIGNHVSIGPYSVITDSDFHHPRDRFAPPVGLPTIIEDDVWLGVRVIVLKGSHIGRGSVITAGSLVSGRIPPNVIAGGVPARVIRRVGEVSGDGDRFEEGGTQPIVDPVIQTRLSALFNRMFGVPVPVDPSTGPADVVRWDSLGHLELIMRLEKEFGITFHDDDAVRMTSFGEIERVIAERLQSRTDMHHQLR